MSHLTHNMSLQRQVFAGN